MTDTKNNGSSCCMDTARILLTTMVVACSFLLTACYSSKLVNGGSVRTVADSVWTYSLSHPDGFTMNLATMTEPSEGVVVAYAATQGYHSRKQLGRVVRHALRHEGYVGGWLDTTDSLYYFDSSRLFPEDSLTAAINFGVENKQLAVFILSKGHEVRLDAKNTTPNFIPQEAEFAECLEIQPSKDTIILKLYWQLAKAELLEFSLAQFDSVLNTLCPTNDRFEFTYWDYTFEELSISPASIRGQFLYEHINKICPNSICDINIKQETLKEGRFTGKQPGYRVLMICRKH